MVSEQRDRTPILDKGYVQLIPRGCWGDDELIVEAARMSTDKGFEGWGPKRCPGPRCMPIEMLGDHYNPCEHKPACDNGWIEGDEKLLRYLWKHKHTTPFEMGGMMFEIQAPIFVFREWHRHRTQSYNEMSARYTPLPDVNYIPTVDRCIVVPGQNKQARGASDKTPTHDEVLAWLAALEISYETAQRAYEFGLSLGIPKEVARLPVPVGRYSRMRASANLWNWLHFLTLRMDANAQWEIRQYANAVGDLIAERFSRTWQLFNVTGPIIKGAG